MIWIALSLVVIGFAAYAHVINKGNEHVLDELISLRTCIEELEDELELLQHRQRCVTHTEQLAQLFDITEKMPEMLRRKENKDA